MQVICCCNACFQFAPEPYQRAHLADFLAGRSGICLLLPLAGCYRLDSCSGIYRQPRLMMGGHGGGTKQHAHITGLAFLLFGGIARAPGGRDTRCWCPPNVTYSVSAIPQHLMTAARLDGFL
eukprot:1158996-Pelagomonas_calceolata.AAC.1